MREWLKVGRTRSADKAATKSIVRFSWQRSIKEAKFQCRVGPVGRQFKAKYNSAGPGGEIKFKTGT